MDPIRLLRCPRCKLQLESIDAAPSCAACGGPVAEAPAEPSFEDDAKMPTQPNAIIPADD